MIRKIEIENFFSFRDRQFLDFSIPLKATDSDHRFASPIPDRQERFPRVVVLYGANASGKTNFLRSISYLANFVHRSAEPNSDSTTQFLTFLEGETTKPVVSLVVEFDAFLFDWKHRIPFRYELVLSSKDRKVVNESLHYFPLGRRRNLFQRNQSLLIAGKDFDLPKKDPVRRKIRDDASVISTLAQFNHSFSMTVSDYFSRMQINVSIAGRHEAQEKNATKYYQENPEIFAMLNSEIAKMDFGINKVELRQNSGEIVPVFHHNGIAVPLFFPFESSGTQRFYSVFPQLSYVLRTGGVAVLDEMDNDIHPLLLPEIIRQFQNPKSNPFNAQLIMSCHNATLLEHLVKEEVVFTEKDEQGATHIFSLADIKGVRRDTNIYAKYLAGVFGGIPKLA